MKRRFYYILCIMLGGFSCCKKDNSNPQIFTENSYPLAVGNWWQYQLSVCSAGGGTSDFTLNIISVTNSGPYKNYKCYLAYNGIKDSGYFLQSDTSLSYTNTSSYPDFSPFPNFYLRFPVSTGQYWQGAFTGDSILVAGVADSCGAYGHDYGACYSTVESYNLPHNFLVKDMLLTPKIGLVSGSINYQSDTAEVYGVSICQSLHLISYYVQ